MKKNDKKGMRKKPKLFTLTFIIMASFMVAANIVLGVILAIESHLSVKGMNEGRMLDIANTAAATLDGDDFIGLTKEDENTDRYKRIKDALTVYQDNIELKYIYCITRVDDDHFVFSVDPTVNDPGEFGSPVVTTDALRTASKGTAAVDDKPYSDDWGTFYSAYSPVFDHAHNVVAIVAVDFSAEQYEKSIRQNLFSVLGVCALSIGVGALLVYIITSRLRKRFDSLNDSITTLAENIDKLEDRISDSEGYGFKIEEEETDEKDDIARLNTRIRSMQKGLVRYLDFMRDAAYSDSLTGVGNKTAYFEKVHALDKQIKDGVASFTVAVFDINGLKKMNDNFGHEVGDRMIVDLVNIMIGTFGKKNLYRIGGDEFIAVLENVGREEMKELFSKADERIDSFNVYQSTYSVRVGFSKGMATFDRAKDFEYRSVFKRADERMYADKQDHYAEMARYAAAKKDDGEE